MNWNLNYLVVENLEVSMGRKAKMAKTIFGGKL